MSSSPKNITEMVNNLQRENEALQGLKKLFNTAVKEEFGYDVKKLHEMLKRLEAYERKSNNNDASHQD